MNLKRYATTGTNQGVGATNYTVVSLRSVAPAAAVRACIYDLLVGSQVLNYSYADATTLYALGPIYYSSAGAGNTAVPQPLDAMDVNCASVANSDYIREPVYYGGYMFEFSLRLRSTFRWLANPGGEFMGLASYANNGYGLGLRVVSSTTNLTVGPLVTIHFSE